MLDSSIQEMRRVAHNMMPEVLVKFGLDAALKDFCNGISQTGALNVQYQSLKMKEADIDQTTSITLYRVVQELVNNALKHASAKNVIVQISRTEGGLTLEVEDDGIGFDTEILRATAGIGWNNIKNRVEFLKGKLDVSSQTGRGTSVHIELDI
jgi:signal transduction histidine kinase